MKSFMLTVALFSFFSNAFADIPPPTNSIETEEAKASQETNPYALKYGAGLSLSTYEVFLGEFYYKPDPYMSLAFGVGGYQGRLLDVFTIQALARCHPFRRSFHLGIGLGYTARSEEEYYLFSGSVRNTYSQINMISQIGWNVVDTEGFFLGFEGGAVISLADKSYKDRVYPYIHFFKFGYMF